MTPRLGLSRGIARSPYLPRTKSRSRRSSSLSGFLFCSSSMTGSFSMYAGLQGYGARGREDMAWRAAVRPMPLAQTWGSRITPKVLQVRITCDFLSLYNLSSHQCCNEYSNTSNYSNTSKYSNIFLGIIIFVFNSWTFSESEYLMINSFYWWESICA